MIETKTSKVKEIKRFSDSVDDYGNYSFAITFDNGDAGYLKGKDKDHPYFIAGQEVPYTIEEIEKKDKYGTYFKIKKPAKEWAGGGGAKWQPKGAREYKAELVGRALKYAYDAVSLLEEEKSATKIKSYFQAFIKMGHAEIDKLFPNV